MTDNVFTIFRITYELALPALLAYIIGMLKKATERKTDSKQADMLTLRFLLIEIHDKYVEKGEIPRSNYETFEEIWTLYHDGFNGNTLTDKFHEEMQNLKVT